MAISENASHHRFDDAEHRFRSLLAQAVALFALRCPAAKATGPSTLPGNLSREGPQAGPDFPLASHVGSEQFCTDGRR
jgi:hypothetical protein